MIRKNTIPKEDIDMINASFSKGKKETITKNVEGRIIKAEKKIVNSRGYEIKSYMGRVLRHNKFVIPKGGRQTLIAKKGQKYDEIPYESRDKVIWKDSDFI